MMLIVLVVGVIGVSKIVVDSDISEIGSSFGFVYFSI
jgi:hypothetical protein